MMLAIEFIRAYRFICSICIGIVNIDVHIHLYTERETKLIYVSLLYNHERYCNLLVLCY